MGVVQREQGDKARFPWFKTPNMDRLAAEGVRFRNAFVVNSLCSPSRACFLTGRYSHLNGVANNHTPFPDGQRRRTPRSCARRLLTGYFGKWHMDAARGQRPGFDYSASFIGQGNTSTARSRSTARPRDQGWVDDVTTDYAIQFLRKNTRTSRSRWSSASSRRTARSAAAPTAPDDFAGEQAPAVPNLGQPRRSTTRGRRRPPRRRRRRRPGRAPSTSATSAASPPSTTTSAAARGTRRPRPRREHGRRLHQRQRLLPRRARPGRQALGLRREPAHPAARPLPEARRRRGGTRRPDGPQHRPRADLSRLRRRRRSQGDAGRSWRPLLEGQRKADWRKAFFYDYFFEQNLPASRPSPPSAPTRAKLINIPATTTGPSCST